MIEASKRPRKSLALPRSPIRLSSRTIRLPPLRTKSRRRAIVRGGRGIDRRDHEHRACLGLEEIIVERVRDARHQSEALDRDEQRVEAAIGGQRAGRPEHRREGAGTALPEERHLGDRDIGLGPRVNRAMQALGRPHARPEAHQPEENRRQRHARAHHPHAHQQAASGNDRRDAAKIGSSYGLCSRFSIRTRSIASFSRSWLKTAKDDQTVLSVNAAIRPRPTRDRRRQDGPAVLHLGVRSAPAEEARAGVVVRLAPAVIRREDGLRVAGELE